MLLPRTSTPHSVLISRSIGTRVVRTPSRRGINGSPPIPLCPKLVSLRPYPTSTTFILYSTAHSSAIEYMLSHFVPLFEGVLSDTLSPEPPLPITVDPFGWYCHVPDSCDDIAAVQVHAPARAKRHNRRRNPYGDQSDAHVYVRRGRHVGLLLWPVSYANAYRTCRALIFVADTWSWLEDSKTLTSGSPRLPSWLHIDAASIPVVRQVLAYQLNIPKDTRKKMLRTVAPWTSRTCPTCPPGRASL